MINVLNRQTFKMVGGSCYVRTYCRIHCRSCNITQKCRDEGCIETLAKDKKYVIIEYKFYEI